LSSGSDIVFRLRQEINIIISNKIHLTIAWLSGHSGVPGNHAVNLLAKLALPHTAVEVVIKPTVPEYFASINQYIDVKWQTIYNSSTHGLHYKIVQPSISRTCKFTYDRGRGLERITARLRLGKCLLNNYLYKLKLHPSGLCDVCGSAETIEHYLIDCVNQTTLRCLLASICNHANTRLTLHTILNNHECLKQIYVYIVSTGRRL